MNRGRYDMDRALAFKTTLSALAIAIASLCAAPVFAQDDSEARLTSRAAPPLSVRALPAAPPVHKLSIGPLTTPAEAATTMAPAPMGAEGKHADSTVDALAQRASHGDADANYRLGLRYLAGDGVARDFIEAFAHIRLAAEAGHPRAISLFYAIGARLTAAEHGKAYLRTLQLRRIARAAR
jgi:TPR repeat protein